MRLAWPVPGWYDRGMTLADKLARKESIVIAGLGDSLTYGWMVERGFFDRFVDLAASKFPESKVTRLNAGVPGDTARGGLARVGRVLSAKPDLLTIQFGLNDLYSDVSVASFEKDIRGIVQKSLDAQVLPVLVTSCPLMDEREQAAAARFYDAIRSVGRSQGVPIADLDCYWRDTQGDPSSWSGLIQPDGVHPTDAGHAIMSQGLLLAFGHIVQEERRT